MYSNNSGSLVQFASTGTTNITIPDALWETWPVDGLGRRTPTLSRRIDNLTISQVPYVGNTLKIDITDDLGQFWPFFYIYPVTPIGNPGWFFNYSYGASYTAQFNYPLRNKSLSFRIHGDGGVGNTYTWTNLSLAFEDGPGDPGAPAMGMSLYGWGTFPSTTRGIYGPDHITQLTSITTPAVLGNLPSSVTTYEQILVSTDSTDIKFTNPTSELVLPAGNTGLIVGSDGQVYVWGSNLGPSHGDGQHDPAQHPYAAAMPGLSNIATIGMATQRSAEVAASGYAVTFDGDLYVWGGNQTGQLGLGTRTILNVDPPTLADHFTPVLSLSGVRSVHGAGGGANGVNPDGQFAVAHMLDGTVQATGSRNIDGVLSRGFFGPGGTTYYTTWDNCILPPGTVASVVANSGYIMFIMTDGTVWGVGRGSFGELGPTIDAATSVNTPTLIHTDLADIVEASGIALVSFFRTSTGLVYALGTDQNGSSGTGQPTDGTFRLLSTPTLVQMPVPAASLSKPNHFSSVSGAIGIDGFVYTWGFGAATSHGDGIATHRSTPYRGTTLTKAGELIAGGTISFVLSSAVIRQGRAWAQIL